MPRQPNLLPAGVRLADRLTFAQMHCYFPVELMRKSLADEGRLSIRQRELPNEFMAYYPVLMCLYREVSQQEVLRVMGDGLQWLHGLTDFKITGRSGISQARARVGSAPLKTVFEAAAIPLAKKGSIGSFYKDLRLTALDGSTLTLEDCEENRTCFGGPKNQHGEGKNPQARLVGLVEVGTRAVIGLAIGKFGQSENVLAQEVIPKLQPGMLCLADQLFSSYAITTKVKETGSHLLFRCRTDRVLPKEERLSDGSFITTIFDNLDRRRTAGTQVRVIDFKLHFKGGGKKFSRQYCLLTTLMDEKKYPSEELANLYRERWEIETMLDEVKTHLMGSQPLRSKTPDLVLQEIYGMMMAHYCVRALMHEAALSAKLDPDELSFTHSKNVIERNMPKFGSFSPSGDTHSDTERNLGSAGLSK